MLSQAERTTLEKAEKTDFMAPELWAERRPLELLGALRDEHGVFWHDMPAGNSYGHPGYWSVLKHKDLATVSRDPFTFSSERQGPLFFDKLPEQEGALISIDPPKHKRLRSFVNPSFLPSSIRQYENFARGLVRSNLSTAFERGSIEFVYDFAAGIPTRTFCRMMNVPEDESHTLIHWVDELSRNIVDPGPHLMQLFESIYSYAKQLADSRAGKLGDDVVSNMMRAEHEDGPLTDIEFGGLFMTIVTGASETTRSLLSNTVRTFCERPDLLDDIRANPEIIDTAIDEFIRIATPINFFRRTATKDVEFQGKQFRENDVIVVWYASANNDPEVFADPEQIDLRRKPNRQIAFGIGEHLCLGERLARMQARIFLEEFSRSVRRVEFDGTPTRVVQPLFNVLESLPVRFTPM